MKHAKVTTYTPQDDGSTRIETSSYHEQLSSIREQIEQHIQTSKDTFLGDIITCLSLITDQKTKELTIVIKSDDRYMPKLITQVYTVKKEDFNKR